MVLVKPYFVVGGFADDDTEVHHVRRGEAQVLEQVFRAVHHVGGGQAFNFLRITGAHQQGEQVVA